MEDKKKRVDYIRCPQVNKEADIWNQLKDCRIYFEEIANNDCVIGSTSQFYDTVRVFIGILPKISSELQWSTCDMIEIIRISLMYTVAACSLPLDGQMMCSVGFCSAISAVLDEERTDTSYSLYLNTDGYICSDFDWCCEQICIKNVEVYKVCLCYGILKSSEASNVLMKGFENGSALIYDMLNTVEEACMKYSRLTSIAFKVLVLWVKKVCLELKLNITGGVLRRIFSVINSNWESPINGVKEQNTKLFELFLDVCSTNRVDLLDNWETSFGSISSLLHCTMAEQPWKMKSKYCILSVLLPRYGVRKAFADFPDLGPGLVSSLSYSHLVSIGSAVYKSCLKDMDADDWTTVFMPLIVEVLTDRDVVCVQKQNALNYWIPSTLKKFPVLLNCLLDQLTDASQSSGLENAVFSVISLLKLGQKGGLLCNRWDENFSIGLFKYMDFLNLMNFAMRHSSEVVRSEAFAVVCMSSKTHILPSLREFKMVQTFLFENVNSDSASLRESILKSFALFLTRICDSSFYALKMEWSTQNSECKEMDISGISQNIQFLNWIHNFLISNLEPGTNYQRRIISLQLYLLILSYFIEPPESTKKISTLRKKGVLPKGKKVMEYALTLGQWPFLSDNSHKTILSCVLDSTDDIRETAGLILMEYFSFDKTKTEGYKPLLDHALQLCTSPMFYETESGALLMKVLGNWTYKMPIKNRNELLCSMTRTTGNKNMARNRNHSSILMLYNQQKLLSGLENKPDRNVHNEVESTECKNVKLKKKVKTYEGMHVMHPSLLEDICNTELSDETKIFEGLTVVAKDGLIGQRTATSVPDKFYSSCNIQTHLGPDSSNSRVNRDNVKSVTCNMKTNGMPCDVRDSDASMKCGDGVSLHHSQFHPIQCGTSSSREKKSLVEDLEEVWLYSASEETSPHCTEHLQNTLQRLDRQAGKEQGTDYQSDIQTSGGPLTSYNRHTFSRGKKKSKKRGRGKQLKSILSSGLYKHLGYIEVDRTQDNQCKSPTFNWGDDFQEFDFSKDDSAYGTVLSLSGSENHKFQQPTQLKSPLITDADFPPLHTRSQDRKHGGGTNSDQKGKEFNVTRSRVKRCGTSSNREKKSLVEDLEEVWLYSASEETSPHCTEHLQNTLQRLDRQAGKEQGTDYQSDIQTSGGPLTSYNRHTFSQGEKKSKKLRKGKQCKVTLSSGSYKHLGYIEVDSTQDNQCKSPTINWGDDFQELALLEDDGAYGTVLSLSGSENHKFQQPTQLKSPLITDADFPSLHTRSQDRKHGGGTNSDQKGKEFNVTRSRVKRCGTSSNKEKKSLVEDLEEVWLYSASEETSPHCTEHLQNTLQRLDRQAGKEQGTDYQSDIQTSGGPLTSYNRHTFSQGEKKSKKLRKGKQCKVTLSSGSYKHLGYIEVDSTQDNQCKSPTFNWGDDFQELALWEDDGAYGTVLSLSGSENHKFQQPTQLKSPLITDADFPPLHTRSQDRKHGGGTNSDQKGKEFNVTRSRVKRCGTSSNKEKKSLVEDMWDNEDWGLSECSKRKTDCKSESNTDTSSYWLHFKHTKQLKPANVTQAYNGSAPLSIVLLTHAETELTTLKADLFQAVSSGSPLHGTLTALIRLATQSDSPEYRLMSADEVNRTVTLLEQTVSFFLHMLAAKSVSTTDVAPSFAEMDEAIQSSIQQSLSDLLSVDEQGLQLSPAHQLVLNCVWLNLKACCTLASGLVCSADCNVEIVKRCGRLITQVLTRCRHKGAIESTGVALSVFVKTVTSETAECNYSSDEDIQLMLKQLLTEFLDSLVYGGKEVSVTRSSAGLSILIHKILASDMRTGKPLLHICMSQLLKIARTSLDFEVSSQTEPILVDLPQAQALHFLKILVHDSSLRQDIAQYMSQVTIICFNNFSSPIWTVRNAALQLSGALIPKLVGQKKIQDEEMTFGSGVSVEEFFSHFPELTKFMLVSLQNAANCHPSQALQQHSDLIPMLSLLAKVAVGSEIFIGASLVDIIAQYRVYFLQLISSPIYHVRKLSAKAYERFMPFSNTYESIVSLVDKLHVHNTVWDIGHSKCLSFGENDLNGILLTLKCLLKKLKLENESMPELVCRISKIITELKEDVNSCMIWDSCTYFNRALILKIIEDNFNPVETASISANETFKKILDVHKTLEKESIKNSFNPGLLLWVAKVIDVVLKKCCPHYLVSAWYNLYTLCGHYMEVTKFTFVSLKWRLLCDKQIDVAVKASLFCALLNVCSDIMEDCHALFPLLDIMLVLMKETKLNVFVTLKELQKVSAWCIGHGRRKSDCSKIALPVVTGLLSLYFAHRQCINLESEILEFVRNLAHCIRDRTHILEYDEDFRLNAAMALHLMAPSLQVMLVASINESFTAVREGIIEVLLDAVLTLLQDEDHNVRIEAAKFVSVYTAEKNQMFTSVMMNPYSSLTKLVQPEVLLHLLRVPRAMKFLWNKLCFFPFELRDIKLKQHDKSNENGSITSPFDHGTNNIYSEETKIIDMLGMSLLDIIKIASKEERSGLSKLVITRVVNFEADAGIILSVLEKADSCGIFSKSSGNETCYIVAKKLMYQSKVREALRIKGNSNTKRVMVKLQQLLKFGTN